MKKLLLSVVLSLVLLAAKSVMAGPGLLELRVGAGVAAVDGGDFSDSYENINSGLELDAIGVANFDAILNFPILPIGIGLRYERGGSDADISVGGNTVVDYNIDYDRFAVLANWRILDNLVFVGPIATAGIHTAEVDTILLASPTSITDDFDADGPSVSLGLEAGFNLKKFILGAEVGYQHMKFKTGDKSIPAPDFSGTYARALIGYKFF